MSTTFPGICCARKGGFCMADIHETKVSQMRVRNRRLEIKEHSKDTRHVEWIEPPKKRHGEAFMKNLAVASALVLCAVTLRTGAIPSADKAVDVVMTAATDQSLLDEQLGKLSFVSALFPEAVLVFGESDSDMLSLPVSGGTVVHAWSEAEPYMSWRTDTREVSASFDGEVIGVYHGNGEERLVQVMSNNGLSCLYGNLGEVNVQTGDSVAAGDLLGILTAGEDFVLEVRQAGMSIDPALYFSR